MKAGKDFPSYKIDFKKDFIKPIFKKMHAMKKDVVSSKSDSLTSCFFVVRQQHT